MEDIKMAYCEVDIILEQLEEKYVNKIPNKLQKLFKEQKRKDYFPEIRFDIPIEEQKLLRKTIAILAMINLNYWCEDEKQKQELIKIYAENDKKREAELREKYNPDNIFKSKIEKIVSEQALVEYKESFFKRIINKIKDLFSFMKH